MRIKEISLSWFRGAATEARLETNSKSVVVYGPNGSGKSSFVDALEYLLEGGRIGHLSHEYSGRKQEKGILNTHIPTGGKCSFFVTFSDGSKVTVLISRDGTPCRSSDHIDMSQWDYKRTILRQDELAAFISARKGDKYSALLPLLDLQYLETAAENLRQLARTIEQRPVVQEKKQRAYNSNSEIKNNFKELSDTQIWAHIRGLHKKYLSTHNVPTNNHALCSSLKHQLAESISQFSTDQKRHYLLLEVKDQDVVGKIDHVRTATLELANETEPLIDERLATLQAAAGFAGKLEGVGEVTCPACG